MRDPHSEHEPRNPDAESAGAPEADALEVAVSSDPAPGGTGGAEGEDAGASSPETPETTDPASEIEHWKDIAARSRAELENFRKRMARERAEAVLYANRSLLEQLIPVIDNFEMGLKAAESAGGEASSIVQGLAMVRRQLDDFLADQGVAPIDADGEAFDPNIHEAIQQEHHDTVPEQHVIATRRRGYRLGDRILRAAAVVVSSGPAEADG